MHFTGSFDRPVAVFSNGGDCVGFFFFFFSRQCTTSYLLTQDQDHGLSYDESCCADGDPCKISREKTKISSKKQDFST
jgi:hypothetical protein